MTETMTGPRTARWSRVLAVLAAGAVLASAIVATSAPQPASAADAAAFDPGNIISDSQFYDGNAMSQAEIQSFLTSRIGTVGGCTNALCLANLRVSTPTRAASSASNGNGLYCNAYSGAANESAAAIIFKVQRACNISAKVILVTLQKEQGLITNRNPTAGRLERAMGYGCPDNSGGTCSASYYGFFNQVYSAAKQFQTYRVYPFGYFQPGTRTVQYNPNTSCGTSTINIRNNATAALYNYTPYRPNAAALANLYGTGDGCSAYGNRNFWRDYSDWFGSPTAGSLAEISPAPVGRPAGSARVGAPLTAVPGAWAPGVSFTYQWLVNGVAVVGETGTTFTPRDNHLGGRASVVITGSRDGFAATSRTSTPSGIIQPRLPDISPAPEGRVAGSARAGLPLTAIPGEWAPGVSFAYQWRVNGVPVEGATGVTFTPVAGHTGGRATVQVTGTRAGFAPTVRVSTASGVIQAPFPQISPAPQGRPAGSARVGAPLTAVPGTWESGTAFTYQWFVNGVAVSGATGVTFTPTQAQVSGRATVVVTGTLAGRAPTARLSTPSGIIQPLPEISPAPQGRPAGSARAGLPLTAVPGEWAPGVSFAYQWRVNGVPVEGATGVTFTPVAAQAGGRATVVITGTRAGFAPTVRVSTASGVIQAPFPQISPAPQGRPAGSARVGAPLTAVPGTWESGTAFTYQWFVNGVAVSGATGVTFTPTQAHAAGRATVAVTGTLTGRTPTTRLSTPSGIIQP